MSAHNAILKLLGPPNYRSFRCIWMLEELGVPYLNIEAEPWSDEVRKYNPLGKVPVLVVEQPDGGKPFSVYESSAINTYLGDMFRTQLPVASSLVPPAGTERRATYDQTLSVLVSELDAQGLWIHRKHDANAMGHVFGVIPDAVAHARKYFHKTNRTLIAQIENEGYLVGDEFTAADICYVHCLDWSKGIGWDDKWKHDDNILEYLKRCKSRPAYERVKKLRNKGNERYKEKLAESRRTASKL